MENSLREKAYSIARRIPKGKVTTYGQIAKLAGNPKASRAVGMFMKTNPHAPEVPCHRVVGKDGSLTGFSADGGVERKREMLETEGVLFKGDKVDMTTSLWQPS